MNLSLPRNSCSWGVGITDTFRNSSRAILETWGTNLQNPCEAMLKIHRPDPGKVFIQADQSGAEALIVAYLTKRGRFRRLFECSIKPHTYMAAVLFAKHWAKKGFDRVFEIVILSPEDVKIHYQWPELEKAIKSDHEKYFIGKKTIHASNYEMQWGTFQLDVLKESAGELALTNFQAKTYIQDHHRTFPEIPEWQAEFKEEIKRTRLIRNLFGHPRRIYGVLTDDLFRKLIAFVPQSTVGTITNIAFRDTQDYIEYEHLDWDVLNNKHDSVLIQVPESQVKEASEILKRFIEIDLVSPRGEKFKMKSEVSVGYNWGKYDKETNPDGLREI